MATTRYYLSSDSSLTPSVTIPVATAWQVSSGFARTLSSTPTGSSVATSLTSESLAGTTQVMSRQFSVAVPSGDTPTVVRGSVGVREGSATTDAFMRVIVRLVASDGTHKATLGDVTHATETSNSTSFLSRSFTASLSAASVSAGDLLVIEVGHNVTGTGTTTQSGAYIGGDSTAVGAGDAALADDVLIHNQTPPVRQWLEVDWTAAAMTVDVTLAGQVQPVTATMSVATVVDATLSGQIAPVTADVTAATLVDVTLAGQVGPVVADVSLEAVPDVVGIDLAGQVAPVTADVALAAVVDADLSGQVGPVTAAFDLEATDAAVSTGVDTNDRASGRTRSGYAVAEWEPAVVPSPSIMVSGEQRRIRAYAFGPVTMHGPQPVYSVSGATAPRDRTRVMVGGKDVSFLDGVPTPEPEWQLAEPLLWGPTSVELPSIPAAFFDPADYPWLAKGKPVVYQRVTASGVKVGVDYRGIVMNWDVSGKTLRVEVGGHSQGRASQRIKTLPIFRDTLDLGRLAWAAVRDLGLRFTPRLGPTTGIKHALFGGMDHLSYISEVCAKAFDGDGQWSLMPDDTGLYSFARKDRETVHWTLFNDDARVVADLRSDAAEEPNRIFAGGVTPKGQRVRFGVYPGLEPGPAAPYPFDDDRTFGLGTLDAETDTGDGVTVMLRKLWTAGYLSLEEMDGFYDATVTRAVMALQDDAGLSTTGNMNPATWDALFDLDVTGYTLRGSRIEPAAQDYRVRRYNRSASGQVIGRNPNFDPSRLIVDRDIDFGSGFTRHQMRDWARAEVYRGEDNWFGTITIHTGGILIGDVAVGATITEADIADVRDIRPGQNVRLPMFGGGILLHISGVEISRTEGGHPVARLTVDTQARDALPVWEQIRRNRETRRDAGRRWKGNRASSQTKDSIDVWDEVGGVLHDDRTLSPGWNKVTVVGGQEGTVSRLRLVVQTVEPGEEIVINGIEFACAVAGSRISPARMETLVPNPLSGDGSVWAEKEAALRKAGILYSAGTNDEPCGYGMGRKSDGATLTGLHVDDAGFAYRCGPDHLLDVLIWVGEEATLLGGRVMWNQLEAGA